MNQDDIRKLKRAFNSRLVFFWRNQQESAYRVIAMRGDIATLHGGGAVQLPECHRSDFVTGTIFR